MLLIDIENKNPHYNIQQILAISFFKDMYHPPDTHTYTHTQAHDMYTHPKKMP